jgi:hypothetical protein
MADNAKTPDAFTFKVTSRIKRGGKTYEPGDTIDLTVAEAETLSAEVALSSKKAVKAA